MRNLSQQEHEDIINNLNIDDESSSEIYYDSNHASSNEGIDDFQENTSETEDNIDVNSEEKEDAEPTVVDIGLCPKYTAKSGLAQESQPVSSTSKRRSQNIVSVRPPITKYSESVSSILDFFNLFITAEMKNIICLHTNEEASRFYDNWNNNHPEKEKNWKTLENDELDSFIGILIKAAPAQVPKRVNKKIVVFGNFNSAILLHCCHVTKQI